MGQSFYLRLITLVDDFGRYEADPELLRSHAFPFGDPKGKAVPLVQIQTLCRQLSESELAIFYETPDGRVILQLLRWNEKPRAERSKYEAFTDSCKQMFADANKCYPPSSSPSSSSSPLYHRHSSKGSPNAFEPTTDDKEWRTQLAKDPAYSHIRVSDEFSKMLRWCEVNKKQPTKRRFINWLNRIEPHLSSTKTAGAMLPDAILPRNPHQEMNVPKPRERSHYLTIRGERWRLIIGRPPVNNCSAYCVHNTRTIYIRLWDGKRHISITDARLCLIHEIIHACFPDLDEDAVEEAEEALSKGLKLVDKIGLSSPIP